MHTPLCVRSSPMLRTTVSTPPEPFPTGGLPHPGGHRPAVMFIFMTLLLDVIGFGLLIPVAPRIVEKLLQAGPEEAAPYYGWLIATYAAMQFIFAPILGALSDRFGRRPVILISLAGSAIDYVAMALSPTLWFLFITRAINGITGANFSACSAYVADVTTPEKRAAGFGMIGAAFGLGFIIGPGLGGLLAQIDLHAPFYAAAGLTALNWLYGFIVLPESLPPARRRPFSLRRANPVGTFRHLVRYPVVLRLAAALFFFNLAMYALHATWVLYTGYRYGWGSLAVGLSLTVVGLGAAVVQGGLVRVIVPRLGEPRSLLIGGLIAVLAYAGYGLATEGWMIYVIVGLASLGGIAGPAVQAIVTKAVTPSEQGEVQGALTSLASVAQAVSTPIGTGVFAYFISARAPVYLPGASFFLCAALAACGLVLGWMTVRRLPRVGEQRETPADSDPK